MLTMVYGDFDGPRRQKNKAKQSQSPAFGRKSEARSSKSETRRMSFAYGIFGQKIYVSAGGGIRARRCHPCRQEVNMDNQGWSNDLAKVLLS